MKDFYLRLRDNLAYESTTTKLTLSAIALVFVFGIATTINGIATSLLQANTAQTAVIQPLERPEAPGYETEIILSVNDINAVQTISEAAKEEAPEAKADPTPKPEAASEEIPVVVSDVPITEEEPGFFKGIWLWIKNLF